MITYDDKTAGVFASGGRFILPLYKECDDVTFKASYIVVPNIKCNGKITALFDLIALGDVEANEIDVKGRFVCLGNCVVNGSIVVQNEIWANDLRATTIESHDRIVAQDIDGDTISADGSIVVGKILAVEKLAKSHKSILCGETAYGAGKIAAYTVITGDPIDLDDGEDAIEAPSIYRPVELNPQPLQAITCTEPIDLIAHGVSEYAPLGDFVGYLDYLVSAIYDNGEKTKLSHWKGILCEAEAIRKSGIDEYSNIAIMIWLTEIVRSDYFKDWNAVSKIYTAFENHFKRQISSGGSAVNCTIDTYEEWINALSILRRYGSMFDRNIYNFAFELVVSNLGLRQRFVTERLKEKGWQVHAE